MIASIRSHSSLVDSHKPTVILSVAEQKPPFQVEVVDGI